MKTATTSAGDRADDERQDSQEREAPALPFAFARSLSVPKSFAAPVSTAIG